RSPGAGPGGAAQREADEGVADHCLIMVLRPMRLQSGMARESRSLAGRRIVVTRAREQAGDLVRALQQLGAEVITAPTIRIEPLLDLAPLGAALVELSRYRWIVFTSRNAVEIVFDRLPSWGLEPRSLARTAIAAIGPATAGTARELGLRVEVEAAEYTATGLVDALARYFGEGGRGDPKGLPGGRREG